MFVVRLRGRDKDDAILDYCVAIDADRGFVIDSCEECCLRMSGDVLSACLGDGVGLECVEEVRKVVFQEKGRGDRKPRKKDEKMREKQREKKRNAKRESDAKAGMKLAKKKKVVESDDE